MLGWLLLKVMTLSSGGLKGGGGFGAQCVSPKKTSTLRQRKGRASPTIHHMILSCDNVMPGRGGGQPRGGSGGGGADPAGCLSPSNLHPFATFSICARAAYLSHGAAVVIVVDTEKDPAPPIPEATAVLQIWKSVKELGNPLPPR